MTRQNTDSDRNVPATPISRRTLLKRTTAGLIGVGMAATGRGSLTHQDPELPHEVAIRPKKEGEQVSYRFRVDGTVSETDSTNTRRSDTIESTTGDGGKSTFVEGFVGNTTEGNDNSEDAYRFAGNFAITASDKPVKVTLELNGRTMGVGDEFDAQSDSSATDGPDSLTGDE